MVIDKELTLNWFEIKCNYSALQVAHDKLSQIQDPIRDQFLCDAIVVACVAVQFNKGD